MRIGIWGVIGMMGCTGIAGLGYAESPSGEVNVSAAVATRVQEFYRHYIQLMETHGKPDKFIQSNRAFLTPRFLGNWEKNRQSCKAAKGEISEGCADHDLILCAQDTPVNDKPTVSVKVKDQSADAHVELDYGQTPKHLIQVHLLNTQFGWQIDTIQCPR